MPRAVVVRGHVGDPRHVELDAPVTGWRGPVEVTLRALTTADRFSMSSREEWLTAFDSWVRAHDSSLPVLPPEALRRSPYEERQWRSTACSTAWLLGDDQNDGGLHAGHEVGQPLSGCGARRYRDGWLGRQ